MPKLPHGERAVVEIEKLREYSLNSLHSRGKHKARVFQAALGLTLADADWLRKRLLQAAHEEEASDGMPSPFGMKYVIDFNVSRGGLSTVVRSSWIIEHGTDFPRLTSCYIK
ncbi:MAG: hypothetical protein LC803_10745 [Acidobacteria bacterium]|nr:hypothetical protein [Acidobacteriota bacterium]